MRRPGLWVANGRPEDPTLMLSWRPGALTSFFDYLAVNNVFGYKTAHPDAPIIIRFQHPLNWQQDPVVSARQLGQQVASKWNEIRALDPYVYFANEMNLHYENGDQDPGNQPFYETPEFYQQYANWVRMTADVIKNLTPEMKLITPPFAFGHHEDGSPDDTGNPKDGWAGYDYLHETVRDYFDNILTFHAYWGNASGSVKAWLYDPELSSWYAFRWRRVLKLFETRYNLQAKMIIDEAGNFGASDPDFTSQIIYHAEECLKDSRVICVTYFLWLDPTNSPGNLPNSWVQQVLNLSEHLARLNSMPDVPITDDGEKPPVQTIRVLFEDGTVQEMPVEEYLRAVVPAEMPALWPIEAVKAQAVASRSYAQYAIEHPRHPDADICATTHCQHYDPARIHPRSDEAIRETASIVALYNGATANALFSANCGGHTLDNEAVWPQGKPVPYLRGVPCPVEGEKRGHGVGLCQYGARAFAQEGQPYDKIIKHYYTGVTLGPPTSVRTSTILGAVFDHTGQPVEAVKVVLTDSDQSAETVTRADGTYRFSNVPAGTYTLEIPAFQVRQENISPTPGQDLVVDLTLPEPATAPITVEIQRSPGLALIVGDWGKPGVLMVITSPSGTEMRLRTGSKPEYGPGGFETYATQTGTYVIEIENYRFEIPMAGQFTRLIFERGGPPEPAGVVEGTLKDHLGNPVSGRVVRLVGDGLNLADETDQAGVFSFQSLPSGAYTVTVQDSPISQTVTMTGQNTITLALQLPAPPPPEEWEVQIERGAGLPLLVGDIGVGGVPITINTPPGQQIQLTSGSKPEYGAGGFEIYAPEPGDYVVQFLEESFTIPMDGQFTRVTFRKREAVEEARLVSAWLPRSQANSILQSQLETNPNTQGLFTLQAKPE